MNLLIILVGALAIFSVTKAENIEELKKVNQNMKERVHFVGQVTRAGSDSTAQTKEHTRVAGKQCYDRPWWMSWQGSPARWEKLNKEVVCFGAKDNQFGSFVYGKSAFVWSLKVEHVRGKVRCHASGDSNFGCGKGNTRLSFFLTDIYTKIQVPIGVNSKFYEMNGFTGDSRMLIFTTGASPFGIHSSTELRVWYGEDLFDSTESDNSGESCVNVYGLI